MISRNTVVTIMCYNTEQKKNLKKIEKIKYILLTARRKQKKTETFTFALTNSIRILSQIHLHPGITTSQLTKQLEVSQRTVQRYIETLCVAGEWIEYDAKTKGLSLTDGKSVLWDEW